jgi:tetratricopeptide (TPR) repeat protein
MHLTVRLLPAALLALAATPLAAQHARSSSHSSGDSTRVPREISFKPISLRKGWGDLHDPVTTKSQEAQAYYNQGLGLLHLFEYLDAARSFKQATRHDSTLAMAYWGLGRALSSLGDMEGEKEARTKAIELSKNASPREQRRINLPSRYDGMRGRVAPIDVMGGGSRRGNVDPYLAALDSALAQYPEDPELWIMRAQSSDMGIAGDKDMSSVAFYEGALARNPKHAGAHHYLVHTYERLDYIDRAVKHGAELIKIAPSVAHARHMYGHDLRRVGRVEDAIEQFETAYKFEREIFKNDAIPAQYDWHHPHNLHLLSMAYQYQGRMKDTERLLREQAALKGGVMQDMYNRTSLIDWLLDRGRFDEVMASADSMIKEKGYVRSRGYIYRGHVRLAKGDIKGAEQELALAAAPDTSEPAGRQSAVNLDSFESSEASYLRAKLYLATGLHLEGARILKKSMKEWRADYGPDGWINTLFRLEAVAKAARDLGAWDLAEYTALQMIDHDRSYGGAHYAMGLVQQQQGKTEAARKSFETAEQHWKKADPDLPELTTVRRHLASR